MAGIRQIAPTLLSMLLMALPNAAHAVVAQRAPGRAELVIYNNNLALVREPYALKLSRGRNEVTLEGVPRRIDSTSVRLEGGRISDPEAELRLRSLER